MGTAERRERERERLREKILDAARDLFTAFGYEAVTMRKIAEKIEYSPTTIYLHFADKNALLRELCSTDFLTLASRFQVLQAESDPIQRLRGIAAAFLRFAQELPNHYRMMFMTPHPPVSVDERAIEKGNFEEDAWAFVKGSVAEAQQAGLLRGDLPSGTVAQLFFAGLHGIAALHITASNDPWIDWRPAEEISELMTETLIRGCAPTAETRRAPRGSARKKAPRT
ncbi:MAG: TetR/AcrR family transcriptional regulator [Acidobacteria bacterium]|nr:MAG: TetR/AcrR family transcriptional regulator [Acidobacteriota bacterium]